jgi:uncharacterized membrane protein
MGRLAARRLLSELPQLETEGVIDAATAERIRDHYGPYSDFSSSRLAMAVFAVLGSLLIGAGVILLLAHNWEHLGRGIRAAISLAPLIASQALVGWVVLKRFGSTAWREGSATLLALSVATALALVDQTYNMGGDLESFLWRWSLLLAPLPWLLNSTAVATIFLAALTWWAGAAKVDGHEVLWLWPLAAAVVPHAFQVMSSDRRGLRAANLGWACAVFLSVAAGLGLEHRVPGLWIVIYCGLFALMIAVGVAVRRDEDGMWRRPLETVGVAGSAVLWLILSFAHPWKHIGWDHIRTAERFHAVASWFDIALAVGLPLAAIVAMAILLDRRRHRLALLWGLSVPLVAVVWPIVAATGAEWLGVFAFNLLVFAVGIATIAEGLKSESLATVNLGMLLVAALVVVRFFDSELGFVVKGLAFIAVGIGFLAANVVLARRLRRDAGATP